MNLIMRLKKVQNMGETEREISTYILENISKLADIDIRDLAKNINHSPSGVTRFIKKLGYNSFSDFKYEIKNYVKTIESEFSITNFEKIFDIHLNAVVETLKANKFLWLKNENFLSICEDIQKSKAIFVFGQGGTYSVVYDFTLKLQRLGYNTVCSNDPIVQETLVKISDNETLFFIFSLSGETKNLVSLSKKIADNKSKLVSITGENDNSVKRNSTYNIPIFTRHNTLISLLSGNRMFFLFAINILTEQLISQQKQFSVNLIIDTSE